MLKRKPLILPRPILEYSLAPRHRDTIVLPSYKPQPVAQWLESRFCSARVCPSWQRRLHDLLFMLTRAKNLVRQAVQGSELGMRPAEVPAPIRTLDSKEKAT